MKKENYSSKNESATNNSDLLSERVNLNENLSNNKHEKEEKTSKTKIQLVPQDGVWGLGSSSWLSHNHDSVIYAMHQLWNFVLYSADEFQCIFHKRRTVSQMG